MFVKQLGWDNAKIANVPESKPTKEELDKQAKNKIRSINRVDLDTVVTGSIDALATYRGDFALLSTRGIDNEGKDFSNGYNSSILMWDAASTKFIAVCECLREHFDLIHRFIHRFVPSISRLS